MEVDVRLTTLGRLSEALALPATTVSVGNDGCPHKLPDLPSLQRAAAEIRRAGRRFAFVVPQCYESFVEAVEKTIASLLEAGPTDLVVNDFGVMIGLAERRTPNTGRITAGHGLSYSYEQQPWVHLTLEKERPSLRQALLKNSLEDPGVWSLLRKAGVHWIQMSPLAGEQQSVETLRAAGFRVATVVDAVPVAFSRSCHTARHYGQPPPACTALCDRPFELRMTHRWRLFHNQLEPMSSTARRQAPPFVVFGNVSYRRVEPSPSFVTDALVFDLRFHPPGSLQARIPELLSLAVDADSTIRPEDQQ